MTFYEAALEVLRRSARPLHYKKITEIAIRDNLLSHVGKTPEVTMSARLNQEVKRQDSAALEKKRPGVFSLRDEVAKKLNEEFVVRQAQEEEERAKREEEAAKHALENPASLEDDDDDSDDEDDSDTTTSSSSRDTNEDDSEQNDSSSRSSGGRGRRRRRRGGRGSRRRDQDDGDTSNERSSRSSSRRNGPDDSSDERSSRSSSRRNGSDDSSSSSSRPPRESRRSSSSPEESTERPQRDSRRNGSDDSSSPSSSSGSNGRRSRNGGSDTDSRRRRSPRSSSSDRAPLAAQSAHKSSSVDQLDGIAKAAYTVLRDQRGESLPVRALADEIFERKLAKFHTHDASATVQAALVHDNIIRAREGKRPLFSSHHDHGRWGLSEWGLSQEGLDKESTISSLAQDCLHDAEALLGQTLPSLAPESLEQMILVILEKLGYAQIKVSKRGSNGDVYFSAQWRRGLSDVRTCIQLTSDRERALETQDITELRGTLHHYAASEGVIIHLGEITRDAVTEAHQERLAPLTLIDQSSLIKMLVQHSLGVRKHHVPIYTVDMSYFDALSV